MHDLTAVATAATHRLYATLLAWFDGDDSIDRDERDRGAVSLEQVLWFVAAGISVAVVATFIWAQIRQEANTPIQQPTAPAP